MRAEQRLHLGLATLGMLLMAHTSPTHAQPSENRWCEYLTVAHISPDTGHVELSRQKIGEDECDEIGAAVGDLLPTWRQRLPKRVHWVQRTDITTLCQQALSELGQRLQHELGSPGCIFLRATEVCTIVSAHALSHAQLANAVRECAQ